MVNDPRQTQLILFMEELKRSNDYYLRLKTTIIIKTPRCTAEEDDGYVVRYPSQKRTAVPSVMSAERNENR